MMGTLDMFQHFYGPPSKKIYFYHRAYTDTEVFYISRIHETPKMIMNSMQYTGCLSIRNSSIRIVETFNSIRSQCVHNGVFHIRTQYIYKTVKSEEE